MVESGDSGAQEPVKRPVGRPRKVVGDEPQTKPESESGFPPAQLSQIGPLTHADPFPPKPKLNSGSLARGRKDDIYVPSNLKLPIGNAASFKKTLVAILEQETQNRPGITIRQILAEMLVNSALSGDKWAHEQIMDRTDGKPTQMMELNGSVKNPLADLSDSQIEMMRALRAQQVQQIAQTNEINTPVQPTENEKA